MMRYLVVMLAVLFMAAPSLRADWAFDDLRQAIKGRLSYDELREIESRYKSRIISGSGYVFMIRKAESINGYEVHLVEEYNKEKLERLVQGDVCVVIPKGSTYSKTAKKLKQGQHVTFSGKLDYIFGKTIYIKGSAKIAQDD